MNKYLTAILISLCSLAINLWIIKQQRAGIEIDPNKKKNLERLSYALIVAAILFLTIG
ncbi:MULTISPECIES: hypothetical protein [Jeotgalibaca]|jgi:uncharacterized membrane protein YvlD (DUF360 family)|uniref:Uncharacterized protein n=1 Tax=Jeotgalibaca arthritidis TaxID=1868794 RepID=A0A6G7K9H5_9LACT|nr:hypothetical protein [Jeotgalibaca arthritidis]QII81908.1 hypothetical protein G7057_05080 [Jeotgalibaca arthritidis]HJB24803.1 hypothetical protein [Candidatus Jeotgalibaca pullicola]